MADQVLPEGVTAAQFERALQEFRRILGQEFVLSGLDETVSYRKVMIAVPEMDMAPSGALLPHTVEQIQSILKVCNQYRIAVWTISTGKNFGYGSAAPATRGQMVLDLRRMNKIIEVDPVLGTALVEPGVTYRQLRDYLDERGYKFWIDVPSPSAIVGPVGNTLERGVGYTPYGDHFMMSCGMEVVLADGQVLRTGMGGVSGSGSWQCFKWGYGPYLDGIFTQSNFGVVTKLGFWLMPAPPLFKPFAVRYANTSDLSRIVETLRPLRIAGLVPGGGIIQSPLYEIAISNRRHDIYDGPGPIPADIIAREAKKLGLSMWNLYAGIYGGTEEQLTANWNILHAAFKASGGIIELEEDMSPVARKLFQRPKELMRGGLTLEEFSMYNFRGGGGSMWFAPVAPAKGEEATRQTAMASEILHKYSFDYICGWVVGWRELHHIIDLLFDRSDPQEMQRAYQCFDELVTTFAKAGYGIYRTNTAFMNKVAETFGPAQRDINRRIKRALDPNGVLAPGKSGIHI
jgi:4-cresol dehydrogenase (hydroxylating)